MVISLHDVPGIHIVEAELPALAAGSGGAVVLHIPFKAKVVSCELLPEAALVGTDTNYAILTLYDRGTDGTGTESVKAVSFVAGTDLAALRLNDFWKDERDASEGKVYELVKTEAGTGAATPRMKVILKFRGA